MARKSCIIFVFTTKNTRWPHAGGLRRGNYQGPLQFKPGAGARSIKPTFWAAAASCAPLGRPANPGERYDVSADVWSATSYKNLRNDALLAERWNMLHPTEPARKPTCKNCCKMKPAPSSPFPTISNGSRPNNKWVPGGLTTLGTDGFGAAKPRLPAPLFEIAPNALPWASCTRWPAWRD